MRDPTTTATLPSFPQSMLVTIVTTTMVELQHNSEKRCFWLGIPAFDHQRNTRGVENLQRPGTAMECSHDPRRKD